MQYINIITNNYSLNNNVYRPELLRPKTQHVLHESMPTSSQTSVIRISPRTIQPKSTSVNSQAQVCWRGIVSSPQQQTKHTNQPPTQWQVDRHPSVVVSSQQHGHILEKALTTVEMVNKIIKL